MIQSWDLGITQYSTCKTPSLAPSHSAASYFLCEFIKVYAHRRHTPDVTSTHHPLLLAALPAHSPNLSHLSALCPASSSAVRDGSGHAVGPRCRCCHEYKSTPLFLLTSFFLQLTPLCLPLCLRIFLTPPDVSWRNHPSSWYLASKTRTALR